MAKFLAEFIWTAPLSQGVTSGAHCRFGVPTRAAVEVRSRHDYLKISAPADGNSLEDRLSHPTNKTHGLFGIRFSVYQA